MPPGNPNRYDNFWTFAIQIILVSILYTWIFNNTKGNILAIILAHIGSSVIKFRLSFEEEVMSNRRRLARERLEIYLVHFIPAYRRLILISGLLLLAYALATMATYPLAGSAILLPAIFLLLLSNSFKVAFYTARLGAWIGTLTSD